MKRMMELITLLNKAREQYEQYDNEIMSNYEYDKLYDELESLEKSTGIIFPNSPTQNIGFEVVSKLKKIKHSSKILSLSKTKDINELKQWLKDKKGMLSWKLDGLTIVCTYENGKLIQAITRGNGETGEDVTSNAKTFINLPTSIPYKGYLNIRGEAIISYENFEKINNNLPVDQKYKNPRNLASGSVRQLSSKISAERNVELIVFNLIKCDNEFETKEDQLLWLKSLGFETVEYKTVNANNLEDAVSYFETNIDKRKFASDGLVLTFNDIKYSKSLGIKTKTPNDSIAFKWKDEVAETKLIDIEWNTSRTGLINPIAIFESVELEGTDVERASVHNVSILEDLKLGIGDTIEVYKANMIIPQILSNKTQSNSIQIPNICPVCGGQAIIKNENKTKTLNCTNLNCTAKQLKLYSHFVGREQMNIEGLSEATLEKFIALGFIRNLTDIYKLNRYKVIIQKLDGFGDKSCTKLLNSIEKSKNVKLANFLYALGIPQIGLNNAKLIIKHFNNNVDAIINASKEELMEIEGVGPTMAGQFFNYFRNKDNLDVFNELLTLLNIDISMEVINNSSSIAGLTFVITGSVHIFANRKELKAKIESLGAKVAGSVTKNVNYLINNDTTSSSGKNKDAKDLMSKGIDIKIISEEEFLKMIN